VTAIFRYEVPVDDLRHRHVFHGDPLGVGLRKPAVVEFWAFSDGLLGASTASERAFIVVGTGHPLPHDAQRHWGFAYDGPFVWHLIEVAA
jgi:hypothetical protein